MKFTRMNIFAFSRPGDPPIVARSGVRGEASGCLPNPKAEGAVISLHRNLAEYMGAGTPEPLG